MVSLLLHTIIISAIFPPNGVETPPSWNRLKRHHRPNSFPDSCLQELEFNAVKTIPVQPDLPLCGVVGGRDIRDVATINIPFQGWCNYDCGTSHKCVWVLKKCGWNYSVHQVLFFMYYYCCNLPGRLKTNCDLQLMSERVGHTVDLLFIKNGKMH